MLHSRLTADTMLTFQHANIFTYICVFYIYLRLYFSFSARSDFLSPWWRHQMETFSALLALCAGNSPVPVNSPHKGQWRGALVFSLIYAWINDWVNNREAGDLRRQRNHYDVIVMAPGYQQPLWWCGQSVLIRGFQRNKTIVKMENFGANHDENFVSVNTMSELTTLNNSMK